MNDATTRFGGSNSYRHIEILNPVLRGPPQPQRDLFEPAPPVQPRSVNYDSDADADDDEVCEYRTEEGVFTVRLKVRHDRGGKDRFTLAIHRTGSIESATYLPTGLWLPFGDGKQVYFEIGDRIPKEILERAYRRLPDGPYAATALATIDHFYAE